MNDNNGRVYIRFLDVSDTDDMLNLMLRNRELFEGVSPKRNESVYTKEVQEKGIENGIKQREEDKRYAFGIFLTETDQLIGDISLFEVQRGPHQKCILGYSMDQAHNGKGYMTKAIQLIMKFAFEEIGLLRVEAGVMPRNVGSMRVLEKAGFKQEGLARKLLEINGVREDHVLFAMLAEDYLDV
ncbi:GNAT family N-acetyltransferase [Paenibacillus sp. 2RAB27]|uniref:GNAT family N-acetyltransferase n=1 Tax=Paenibacillus sp. 2RAB27 TaxID=3232991 RepID=UPI003F9DD921